MSYEYDLAFNLRLRGVAEQQIAEAIEEAKAHTVSTSMAPEAGFGTPEQYAATFPRTTHRTRGAQVSIAAAVVSLAYGIAIFALKPLFDFDIRTLTGPMMLWPGSVIVGTGILGGFLLDHLHPKPSISD